MSKTFEIKNMRTVQNCGTLRATFTAAFKALELNDCKLVDGRDGLFFSPPARQYEKDGQKKYANYFYITSEQLKREIETDAIAAYQAMEDRQGQAQSYGGGVNPQNEPPFNPEEDIPFRMPQCYREV